MLSKGGEEEEGSEQGNGEMWIWAEGKEGFNEHLLLSTFISRLSSN